MSANIRTDLTNESCARPMPGPAQNHRMVPGSHERPGGAECLCGAAWDRWNDECADTAVTR